MTPYASELALIRDALPEVYRIHGSLGQAEVMDKSAFDLVTQVDLRIEKELIRRIRQAFPGDHILSE